MNKGDLLRREMARLLEPVLQPLGFTKYLKTLSRFIRQRDGVRHIVGITFPGHPSGVYSLDFYYGIRFEEIEALRNRYQPDTPPHCKRHGCTFGTLGINLLRGADPVVQVIRPVFAWNFSEPEQIADRLDGILTVISKCGLPYLDRLQTLDDLLDIVEVSEDPYILDFEDRLSAWLLAYALLNNRDRIREMLPEMAIVYRKMHPQDQNRFDLIVQGVSTDYPHLLSPEKWDATIFDIGNRN